MKLDENEVKNVVFKVYKDLNIDFNDKYPIKCNFFSKENDDRYKVDYWVGFYDYSGLDEDLKTYSNNPVIINNETGKPISILIFPSETSIKVDVNGKYAWGNVMPIK